MFKNIVLYSLVVLVLAVTPPAYASKVELTTSYSAPSGEYASLSATRSMEPPIITTAERNAITAATNPPLTQGMVIFNSDVGVKRLEVYNGTGWVAATAGGSASIATASGPLYFNTSSDVWGVAPNVVSMTQWFPARAVFVSFEHIFVVTGGVGRAEVRLRVDGVVQIGTRYADVNNASITLSWAGTFTAGSHTIEVQCRMDPANPGSVSAQGYEPKLVAIF